MKNEITLEKIAQSLRDAQRETGQKIPESAVLVVNEEPTSDERCCGLEVVYVSTAPCFTLGRCSWRLARAFETVMSL